MVVLGLLLLAGAAMVAAATISSNTGAVEVDLWGMSVSDVSIGVVFAGGMIAAAVALLGLMLMLSGARRNRKLWRERRALARDNRKLARHAERHADADTDTRGQRNGESDRRTREKAEA